jgi:hypothetical protein
MGQYWLVLNIDKRQAFNIGKTEDRVYLHERLDPYLKLFHDLKTVRERFKYRKRNSSGRL